MKAIHREQKNREKDGKKHFDDYLHFVVWVPFFVPDFVSFFYYSRILWSGCLWNWHDNCYNIRPQTSNDIVK